MGTKISLDQDFHDWHSAFTEKKTVSRSSAGLRPSSGSRQHDRIGRGHRRPVGDGGNSAAHERISDQPLLEGDLQGRQGEVRTGDPRATEWAPVGSGSRRATSGPHGSDRPNGTRPPGATPTGESSERTKGNNRRSRTGGCSRTESPRVERRATRPHHSGCSRFRASLGMVARHVSSPRLSDSPTHAAP